MSTTYNDPDIIFISSRLTYDGERASDVGAGKGPTLPVVRRREPAGAVVRRTPKGR